ncbi:MAG: hypothetical protein KA314_15905 [Chloroflexi bacterium]|nr:hypothetical protein [Chloroflexota bacterium]MBP8057320.1 hypothetical protein [Chloroflexota bacterium]
MFLLFGGQSLVIGVLVYWCVGVLVCWCIGVLVYWSIGVLVYWFTIHHLQFTIHHSTSPLISH